MLTHEAIDEALAPFFTKQLITEVCHTIKSGKEASVYLCEADPSTGVQYLAAKIYRPRESRAFKNDAIYHAGEFIGDLRVRKAVAQKTRFGREVQFRDWVEREFQALRQLHAFGADVPKVHARSENAILMQFIGEGDQPATPLNRVTLDRAAAAVLFDRIMTNVALGLSLGLIHADLSAFNILYQDGRVTVIDFPQVVDARTNPHAYDLLQRDIDNVCRYFGRFGVAADGGGLAWEMWSRLEVDDMRLS